MVSLLRPKHWVDIWFGVDFLLELGIALVAFGTGAMASYRLFTSESPEFVAAWVYAALAIISLALVVIRAILRQQRQSGKQELHALDGALHMLYATLLRTGSSPDGHNLRICVFVPHDKKPDTVHQLTDYVDGNNAPHGRGRDLKSSCGVVGLAFRSCEQKFDKLPPNTHVTDYLVATYGFDRKEAAVMNQNAKAWAAVPVGTGVNRVVAVLFLDCSVRDFFGKVGSQRRKLLEAATIGIAGFVTHCEYTGGKNDH